MRAGRVVAILALVAALGACGEGERPAASGRSGSGRLTVFAAASLADAFTALGEDFEAAHGIEVTFNFAASSALVQQLNEGGSADVFVSADEANLQKVVAAGIADAGKAEVVARNRLAIVVEPGNPKRVTGLADLADADVVTVLCAPEVPCGTYAAAALAKAAVTVEAASLEENVKGVVAKVTLGEADAGIVYVTDVEAAGDRAEGVDIDIADDPELEAVYPMVVTSNAVHPEAAAAWVAFVLSDGAQETLATFGFLAP